MKGKPRPKHVRKKISRGQQERHRRAREQAGPLPDKKRCPKCKQWKPSPKEFGWTKRKLVSGEVVFHPRSWCKACQAERSRKYREELKRRGILDQKQREWSERRRQREREAQESLDRDLRKQEARNAYRREWRKRKRMQTDDDPQPKPGAAAGGQKESSAP